MNHTGGWILVAVVVASVLLLGIPLAFGETVKREWRFRQWRRRWKATGYPRRDQ